MTIKEILEKYKTIAVVGLSSEPWRASYSVSQYMQEAGYRKGADGLFESPTEGHLQFQVKSTTGAQNSSERTIMATQWKPAGFDVVFA